MGKGFGEKVLACLLEYKSQTVTLAQICKATNLTEAQVQHTVSNLRNGKKDLYTISTVLRGRAWRLVDAPTQETQGKRVFEEIGTTKDGRIVIQDSEGSLFIAIPM